VLLLFSTRSEAASALAVFPLLDSATNRARAHAALVRTIIEMHIPTGITPPKRAQVVGSNPSFEILIIPTTTRYIVFLVNSLKQSFYYASIITS